MTTKTKTRKTKADAVLKLLKRDQGASLAEIAKATNWQEHSIRGFLSGTVKKKKQLNLVSEPDSQGVRRYRIEA